MERIILTTGGTGGHVFPALSVAEEVLRRNPRAMILFMGGRHGQEADMAAKAGLDFVGLPVRGVLGRGGRGFLAAFGMLRGLIRACGIIRKVKPELVIGFGGYAGFAGVLASQWSKTGKVGHFSGEKVPPGLRGRAAYADGLRRAGFEGQLVTQFCGHQHRPGWARTCVSAMVEQTGLDIVFAMLDGGRPGVTQACRAHGVAQIGNVLNWVERDPEVFVASAICDSGEALFRAVEDHARGLLPLGGYRAFGLEEPSLVRLEMGGRVSAAQRSLVEDWAQRLLRREFEIHLDYAGAEFALPQEELSAAA